MKIVLTVLALALAAGPVVAQDAAPPTDSVTDPAPQAEAEAEVQPVFRAGDPAMTCPQISDEAAQLSQQMGGSQGGGVFSSVVEVGRAGASLLVPGAGLAFAGADALTRSDRERKAARERLAEQRWYYLNGLYTGLRCNQAVVIATPQP